MTLATLQRLDASRVFQPVLSADSLSALHVPFDELTGSPRHEARLLTLSQHPARIMVSGESGSGKTSIAAWSVSPLDGMFGVVVPVHAHVGTPEIAPTDLAALVIDALRSTAADSTLDFALADERRRRWRASGSVNLGVVSASLEEQLPSQRAASLAAQQDALAQAFSVIRAHGLEPVLILDDTDKWVRLGDPHAAVGAFFDGPVRWLIEQPAGLIVHVHDRYLDLLGSSADVFDERVALPNLTVGQVRQVVVNRVEAVGVDADEVFDSDALDALLGAVVASGRSVRTSIRLAGHAVTEAVIAGKASVEIPDVEAALVDGT